LEISNQNIANQNPTVRRPVSGLASGVKHALFDRLPVSKHSGVMIESRSNGVRLPFEQDLLTVAGAAPDLN
jgi:hypothetical protein